MVTGGLDNPGADSSSRGQALHGKQRKIQSYSVTVKGFYWNLMDCRRGCKTSPAHRDLKFPVRIVFSVWRFKSVHSPIHTRARRLLAAIGISLLLGCVSVN